MPNKIVKDLNQGSVTKTMILFAMPLLLSGVIQMLYNTADMIIVGHFVGTKGLAAVSVGGIPSFIAGGFLFPSRNLRGAAKAAPRQVLICLHSHGSP